MVDKKDKIKHNKKADDASHLTSDKSKSYEEVSFDVLEQAVEKKNKKSGYKNRDFKNRAIISSEEMLPQKKFDLAKVGEVVQNPQVAKLSLTVIIFIVVIAAVVIVLNMLNSEGAVIMPRDNSPLKVAVSEIASHDKDLIKLNSLLQTFITEEQMDQAKINKETYENLKSDLSALDKRIDDLMLDMDKQSEEYQCAICAKQTIESRLIMVDSGLAIYDRAHESLSIIRVTEDFWNKLIEADSLLKESDNLIQSNEDDNFLLAKENSEKAVSLLKESKDILNNLKNKTSTIDFNSYMQYVDKRLDSAELSIQCCQALIDHDVDKITELNKLYIEKSNAASDVALNLSTTPVQIIRTNYDVATRPLIDQFKAARKNAAMQDLTLRNFLYAT